MRKRGIWVMDRGGDRSSIFNYLLHNKLRFLIRVRGDRGLRTVRGIEPAVDLIRSCPVLFYETVVREEAGHERLVHLSCGMRKVCVPDRREEPLMILTNLAVRRSRKSVRHVITSYITRWRIEDVIRFVKQSCRREDIRCLTYHRLQALMVLVTAAALPCLRAGRARGGRGKRGLFLIISISRAEQVYCLLAGAAGFLIPIGSSGNFFATFRGD